MARPLLFISHASEDKDAFVRPLAHLLRMRGTNVWYDEFSLKPGDSLRRSIDRGLCDCDFGIVVLSPSFFAKEWPQRELDALLTSEIGGSKKIIPIWHNLDAKAVAKHSLMLADKVAISSKLGVDSVAASLIDLLPSPPGLSNSYLASVLETHMSQDDYVLEWLSVACEHRFLQIQAFFSAYQNLIDERMGRLGDDELDEQVDRVVNELRPRQSELRTVFGIPPEIECAPDEPLPIERRQAWVSGFEEWVSGTMDEAELYVFLNDLDIYFDVDHLYLLLGLPNYSVSERQRELLDRAIRLIGTWVESRDSSELEAICVDLRNGERNDQSM